MPTEQEFVLGGSKYSQLHFSGRFFHFLNVIDPRTLFTSDKKLNEAISLLEQYKQGNLPANIKNDDLWNAQKIKQAIIHPDTGKKIPMPFRMSGFVPFGSPIVVGLLLPNQTLLTTTFWQWLNQSHNACVNYCNRNASQNTSTKDVALGYLGAITSAVGIALGLNVLLKKSTRFSPSTLKLMQRFIPFPAVATASISNVVLMRHAELSTGIEVYDGNGNAVGISKIAAKKALQQTAATRAFLPAPILLIPPICMSILERILFFKKYPRLHLPAQVFFATASFGLALPLAIALFPQMSEIPCSALEKDIQNKSTEKILYYNKGL